MREREKRQKRGGERKTDRPIDRSQHAPFFCEKKVIFFSRFFSLVLSKITLLLPPITHRIATAKATTVRTYRENVCVCGYVDWCQAWVPTAAVVLVGRGSAPACLPWCVGGRSWRNNERQRAIDGALAYGSTNLNSNLPRDAAPHTAVRECVAA